ncbi:MAG: hypothetical protein MJ248_00875 [Bacilli bacterium]|nr:hypothetical protein [Bacilli bacterium]
MKYALKKWWNYLIGFAGYLLAATIALLPRILLYKGIEIPYKWPKEWISYTLIFVGIVFSLIGFIIQDVYRARIRHRINDWDNELPDEYLNKAWMIFLPFVVAGLLSFVTGLLFLIPTLQF